MISRRSATDLLIGISFVNVLFLNVWRLLFDSGTPAAFYRNVSRSDYLAALVCTLGGGLLLGGVVILVRNMDQPWLVEVARCCFLATALNVADSLRRLRDAPSPEVGRFFDWAEQLGRPAVIVIGSMLVVLVVVFVLVIIVLAWHYRRPLASGYALVLICVSPFIAVTVARSVWSLATLRFDQFAAVPNARPSSSAPSANRVVVVLFDELDYGMVFGDREPDPSLPEFDRFRAASSSFDNVQSPARNTSESIPSYLFGHAVQKLEPLGPRAFELHLQDGRRVRGDSLTSFIERAAHTGVRAAVVGFYLPYCRLPLARTAVHCRWQPFVADGIMSASASTVTKAVVRQLRDLNPLNNRRTHMRRVQQSVRIGTDFAADPRLDLVFLHLPIPHQPSVYDRQRKRYVALSLRDGYINNLALADRVLGEIRRAMEASGTWDSSTVIVTSDHGWRANPARTSDDTRHIPFLVKAKEIAGAVRDSTPLNSLLLGNLVLDVLNGAPASAPEVIRVLSARPSFP